MKYSRLPRYGREWRIKFTISYVNIIRNTAKINNDSQLSATYNSKIILNILKIFSVEKIAVYWVWLQMKCSVRNVLSALSSMVARMLLYPCVSVHVHNTKFRITVTTISCSEGTRNGAGQKSAVVDRKEAR